MTFENMNKNLDDHAQHTTRKLKVLSMTGIIELGCQFDILTFAMHFEELDEMIKERVEIINFSYGDCGDSGFFTILEFKFDKKIKCKIFTGSKIQFTGARTEQVAKELVEFLQYVAEKCLRQTIVVRGLRHHFYDLFIKEDTSVLYSISKRQAVGKKLVTSDYYVFNGKRCQFDLETGAFVSANHRKSIMYRPDTSIQENDIRALKVLDDINCKILHRPNEPSDLSNFNYRIVNIWSNTKIRLPCNIGDLAAKLQMHASPTMQVTYEPQLYKGINVKIFSKPGGTKLVSVIIKSTGLVIVTGNNLFAMQSNFTYLYQKHMMHNHIDYTQTPEPFLSLFSPE